MAPVRQEILSPATIARYAYAAGFRGQALTIAIAIALAESSGDRFARGDTSLANSTWGSSIGLWQVRSLKAEYGSGGVRDAFRLTDPAFNAKSAFSISGGGTNFNPWTQFKNGTYQRFMGQAQAAAAQVAGGDAAVAGGIAGGAYDLGFQSFDTGSAADRAKSLYGYLGWFIDHPEVGPIILRAAEQGWDAARLQGALVNTNWWRHTSESARQFDALLQMDPATASRRITETGTSIRLQAEKFGIGLNSNQIFQMAANALRLGWNPQEIQLAIAGQMKWNKLSWATGGGVGTIMSDVQRTAAQFMVPVTAKQAWQWARRVVGGLSTMDAVESQFRLIAAVKYPHLVKELGRGVTPAEFFAPHRNVIAEMLEVSPESIDLMADKKWSPVVSFRDRNKTRAMTLTEAARYARMRPEWARTANAWQQVTEAGDAILQIFGEVAR